MHHESLAIGSSSPLPRDEVGRGKPSAIFFDPSSTSLMPLGRTIEYGARRSRYYDDAAGLGGIDSYVTCRCIPDFIHSNKTAPTSCASNRGITMELQRSAFSNSTIDQVKWRAWQLTPSIQNLALIAAPGPHNRGTLGCCGLSQSDHRSWRP